MKEKVRILILVIGFLIMVALASSIFYDLLLLTIKGIVKDWIMKVIVFILTCTVSIFMLKLPPFDELGKAIDNFGKKLEKKIRKFGKKKIRKT